LYYTDLFDKWWHLVGTTAAESVGKLNVTIVCCFDVHKVIETILAENI